MCNKCGFDHNTLVSIHEAVDLFLGIYNGLVEIEKDTDGPRHFPPGSTLNDIAVAALKRNPEIEVLMPYLFRDIMEKISVVPGGVVIATSTGNIDDIIKELEDIAREFSGDDDDNDFTTVSSNGPTTIH